MTAKRILPILFLALLLAAAACQRGGWSGNNPETAAPVDTARVHAAEVGGWGYRREVSADLDGDGKLERLVIAADVQTGPTGPLWQGANRWAVYVEPAKGERTLLYGAVVPNGFTEAAVLQADQNGRRKVLIQERTPEQVRSMGVEYDDGKARMTSAATYKVGEWLPGSAAMH